MSNTTTRFEVGDWIRAVSPFIYPGTYRVTQVMDTGSLVKHLGSGAGESTVWRSNCRPATPEEVAAVPIKNGDWAVGAENASSGRHRGLHRCGNDACTVTGCALWPSCRHATPDEYRAATGAESPGQGGDPLGPPGDDGDNNTAFGPIYVDYPHLPPSRDDHLEQSGDKGRGALVTKALEEHAAGIQYLRECSTDDAKRLDQIEAEVSPNTLKARMETDRSIRDDTAKRVYDRLDKLETDLDRTIVHLATEPAAPVEPELPPLLKNRIDGATIVGPFILVNETPDNRGRLMYFRGQAVADAKTKQGVVRLWPATLIPVKPEPEVPAATLDALRTMAAVEKLAAHESGHRDGFAEARRTGGRWLKPVNLYLVACIASPATVALVLMLCYYLDWMTGL